MNDTADASRNRIEQRLGQTAAAEWQLVLNCLALSEAFVLVVIAVPNPDIERICRDALTAWFEAQDQTLTVIVPASQAEMHQAAASVRMAVEDPSCTGIWLAAASDVLGPDATDWELAWRHALIGLNMLRNPMRRNFPHPLLLVGNTHLITWMREVATDLWSVRSLSVRIEPALREFDTEFEGRIERDTGTARTGPDPDLALRMVDRARGQAGQEAVLAAALDRAGRGFEAQDRRPEAIQAWTEAAGLYEALNQLDDAVRMHLELGSIFWVMGQIDASLEATRQALRIQETLVKSQPGHVDHQRDLSGIYNVLGDVYLALGQNEAAAEAYGKDFAITEQLAKARPDRADYQQALSVSYEKMGDLHVAAHDFTPAHSAYARSLAIAERLAQAEPDRADYQRDLAVSYEKIGDLSRKLGRGEAAREAHARSLAIREKLIQAQPDRADYQRDLSVSYEKMGNIYRGLDQVEAARDAYARSLAIRETLARAAPDRADYQRDVIVALSKIAEIAPAAEAAALLHRALAIADGLRQSNRLQPVDAQIPGELKRRLDAVTGSPPR
jgi:tetratricopeptide (TPR) repeat protein